uniref:Secreted protein n=1 Tax=Ixodes ricinus TaxID=34613 RepID=A0A6B0UI81_IXORI
MCRFSLLACVQAWLQMWQRYGFSPVCDRRCTIRLLWNRKDLPQYSHDLSCGDDARDDGPPSDEVALAVVAAAGVVGGAAPANAGGVSLRGDVGAVPPP